MPSRCFDSCQGSGDDKNISSLIFDLVRDAVIVLEYIKQGICLIDLKVFIQFSEAVSRAGQQNEY